MNYPYLVFWLSIANLPPSIPPQKISGLKPESLYYAHDSVVRNSDRAHQGWLDKLCLCLERLPSAGKT